HFDALFFVQIGGYAKTRIHDNLFCNCYSIGELDFMLPIADINPTRRFPILTWGLIAVNVLVFLWAISMPESQLEQVFRDLAAVPRNATALGWFAPETLLDIVRSMFFHGGWDHIIGNMLYLYLFGDNVEDRFG